MYHYLGNCLSQVAFSSSLPGQYVQNLKIQISDRGYSETSPNTRVQTHKPNPLHSGLHTCMHLSAITVAKRTNSDLGKEVLVLEALPRSGYI